MQELEATLQDNQEMLEGVHIPTRGGWKLPAKPSVYIGLGIAVAVAAALMSQGRRDYSYRSYDRF